MTFDLYKEVSLKKDVAQYNLRAGDIGTIVESFTNEGNTGYAVEFFNAIGESVAVVVVDENEIELLKKDEIFHIRKLVSA